MRVTKWAISILVTCVVSPLCFAGPVETSIPGVTATLVELRQNEGVVRLALRIANGSSNVISGKLLSFNQLTLVDPDTRQKHFGIKDAEGHYLAGPVSDWNNGGRWVVRLPPGGEALIWMLFEPIAPGSMVSVEAPLMFPFDDVAVTEGAPETIGTASSTPVGLRLTLVSARRARGQLDLRLKVNNSASVRANLGALKYRDVSVFDGVGKREFTVLKDAEGQYVAQPKSDGSDGGRFWLNSVAPGATQLMSLSFEAPPDDVQQVDLLLPGFMPLEGIQLTGLGGATSAGIATAGRTLGLEGALKALAADVTPTEIHIDLAADVLFGFDSAEIKPAAEDSLNNLLTVVNAHPSAGVAIVGHTDVRGDESYNQALSERRAQAVSRWLQAKGVMASRLTATGAGESHPLRTGTTEEDHQANRRVEIRISTGDSPSVPAPTHLPGFHSTSVLQALFIRSDNEDAPGPDFPTGVHRMEAEYAWANAKPGLNLHLRWMMNGTTLLEQSETVKTAQGSSTWQLMLSGGSVLPDGDYMIQVLEDGQALFPELKFRIGR